VKLFVVQGSWALSVPPTCISLMGDKAVGL
jgi:hypothetical protein